MAALLYDPSVIKIVILMVIGPSNYIYMLHVSDAITFNLMLLHFKGLVIWML
jgi:hypothetical protein